MFLAYSLGSATYREQPACLRSIHTGSSPYYWGHRYRPRLSETQRNLRATGGEQQPGPVAFLLSRHNPEEFTHVQFN